MIKTTFEFKKSDQKYLKSMPKRLKKGLLSGMRNAMFFGEKEAKSSFDKPGHLKARSGHLRRSIRSGIKEKPLSIVGWIFTDVIYGRINELGGIIRPKKGKYLKFQIAGKWVMVKKVTIPAKPYLGPAITDHINQIKNIIIGSTVKAF